MVTMTKTGSNQDMKKPEPTQVAGDSVKRSAGLKNLVVPQNAKHRATNDPAIPLLGSFPRGMKTYPSNNFLVRVTTALFVVVIR